MVTARQQGKKQKENRKEKEKRNEKKKVQHALFRNCGVMFVRLFSRKRKSLDACYT